VHFLNYRDSGMPGSPDNKHPNALAAASLDQVTGDVVAIIRKIKPQVVLTFDPIGGYRHPDHIAIHQAAVKAFQAASDPQQYPDSLPAFQPQKLYFHTMPHGWLRLIVKVLPLFGRDPRKFGRNADIDLVSIAEVSFPTHAVVDYRPVAAVRDQASACHASQGGTTMAGGLFGRIRNWFGANERFMRAYPEPRREEALERDLFTNVSV
jgi:LmbE family N-acetylglucosaminyl deacetylase